MGCARRCPLHARRLATVGRRRDGNPDFFFLAGSHRQVSGKANPETPAPRKAEPATRVRRLHENNPGELEATSGNQVFSLKPAKPIQRKLVKFKRLQRIVEALGGPRSGDRSGGIILSEACVFSKRNKTRCRPRCGARRSSLVTVKVFLEGHRMASSVPRGSACFTPRLRSAFTPNILPKRHRL